MEKRLVTSVTVVATATMADLRAMAYIILKTAPAGQGWVASTRILRDATRGVLPVNEDGSKLRKAHYADGSLSGFAPPDEDGQSEWTGEGWHRVDEKCDCVDAWQSQFDIQSVSDATRFWLTDGKFVS